MARVALSFLLLALTFQSATCTPSQKCGCAGDGYCDDACGLVCIDFDTEFTNWVTVVQGHHFSPANALAANNSDPHVGQWCICKFFTAEMLCCTDGAAYPSPINASRINFGASETSDALVGAIQTKLDSNPTADELASWCSTTVTGVGGLAPGLCDDQQAKTQLLQGANCDSELAALDSSQTDSVDNLLESE